jgi:hypothetical protein
MRKNGTMQPEVAEFLKGAHGLGRHNAVRAGRKVVPLLHPFWRMADISSAWRIQAEWNVDPPLLPFYGDWHDLICVDTGTSPPSVVMLSDDRAVVHRWTTLRRFVAALCTVKEQPLDTDSLVKDEWFDF